MDSLLVVAFMYVFFFVIELVGAAIAYRLDREDGRATCGGSSGSASCTASSCTRCSLKSVQTAISGKRTGWGKLERKGTVELIPEPEG